MTNVIEEINYITEFLESDKSPKDISSMSYDQVKKSAQKWVKSLQKESRYIQESPNDTKIILDFKDGFKIVKLIGKNAYKKEGFIMNYNVFDYYDKNIKIYALRDPNNNTHCIIKTHKQHKGELSTDVHPKHRKYIIDFLKHTGIRIMDYEMEHLGYKRVKFPEYCKNKLLMDKYIPKKEKEIYDKRKVIIFKDIVKAVEYKGKRICLFDGNVNFRKFKIKSLGKLKAISGDAIFKDSNIRDLELKELEHIGGLSDMVLVEGKNINQDLFLNMQKSLMKVFEERKFIE